MRRRRRRIRNASEQKLSIRNVSVFRNDARNVIDNHLKTLKAS